MVAVEAVARGSAVVAGRAGRAVRAGRRRFMSGSSPLKLVAVVSAVSAFRFFAPPLVVEPASAAARSTKNIVHNFVTILMNKIN